MAGPQVPNQAKLDGLNPLAYLGVRPSSPPQLLVQTRNPTVNDNKYVLGTLWLNNNSPYDLWILVNLAVGVATWEQINSGGAGTVSDLTSNTGGPVGPTAGNINVVGDGTTITGVGNAGTSTITLSVIGSGVLSTLTGNSGGAVSPNLGNINLVGDGVTVNVVGNPAGHSLTISASGLEANSFPTDSGTATPSAGVLNVKGGTTGRDINTSGSGNTIHIDLNNAITLGDLSAIGAGSPAISCTTGDVDINGGNLNLPNTNFGGTQGVIQLNNARWAHNYGTVLSTYVGQTAGNTINTGTNNAGFGSNVLNVIMSGSNNTAIGDNSGHSVTTGSQNTLVGRNTGSINTGSYNTAIGYNAGSSIGGSNSSNVLLANVGAAESNTMRIGTSGSGNGQVNRCFLAGVNGVNVGSVASVVSISGDQLGSTTITAGSGITVTPGANTITISGSGSITFTYTNVNTSPYVVLTTDEYLSVDCSGGPITVQLPNAATLGKTFIVKDRTGSAGTNNITVTTVGGAVNIDGATTFVMNTAYESINVLGNGSTYEVW